MSLAHYAQNAATAERMRRKVRREGYTMSGSLVWTPEEDKILKRHYPDYDAAVAALPGRTKKSCYHRAIKLSIIGKRCRSWTAAETSKFRKMYSTATLAELREAFPGRTKNAFFHLAHRMHVPKKRKPYKETGIPALDELRRQCLKSNLYMHDLDALVGKTDYFSEGRWWQGWRPRYQLIIQAIFALDGKLKVEWSE